jgi:arylsulfatase A-like enzyme
MGMLIPIQVFVLLCTVSRVFAPKPPNIALIIVDDLAVDAIGAYRSSRGQVKTPSTLGLHKLFEHIPTPALDKLAEDGVLFTRA